MNKQTTKTIKSNLFLLPILFIPLLFALVFLVPALMTKYLLEEPKSDRPGGDETHLPPDPKPNEIINSERLKEIFQQKLEAISLDNSDLIIDFDGYDVTESLELDINDITTKSDEIDNKSFHNFSVKFIGSSSQEISLTLQNINNLVEKFNLKNHTFLNKNLFTLSFQNNDANISKKFDINIKTKKKAKQINEKPTISEENQQIPLNLFFGTQETPLSNFSFSSSSSLPFINSIYFNTGFSKNSSFPN